MSKLHKDDLEVGTSLYSYTLRDNDGSLELSCKEGKITNLEFDESSKMLLFEDGRRVYFQRRHDYSLHIDECYESRVLLLSRDDERALELFLRYEYDRILYHEEEINRHKTRIELINSLKGF